LKEENKPVYQVLISKKIDSTYAHTLKVLNSLNEFKLVQFEETGRIKLVKLTETGVEVANTLDAFVKVLGLANIEKEIDHVYMKEVKGKLRADIDKEGVLKSYNKIKDRIKVYFEGYPKNISILARKLVTRVDTILAEALGYLPETEIPHEEGQT
jgi:chorismate mutase